MPILLNSSLKIPEGHRLPMQRAADYSQPGMTTYFTMALCEGLLRGNIIGSENFQRYEKDAL
jgi:hypothetical protein